MRGKHGFWASRDGRLHLTLKDEERGLLLDLLAQLVDLVAPPQASEDPLAAIVGLTADAERPSDPALARLFPDAYEEAEAAAEFRRFTQADLRKQKADNADIAAQTISHAGTANLTADEAQAWLRTLNDLRLVLGVRLGITEENSEALARGAEPTRSIYLVYDWLTYEQDRLLHLLTRS